jgi:hypothetical protein
VKASDFAQWAGPRAMHIENAVTVVSSVTIRNKINDYNNLKTRATVTTSPETLVTAVTKGGAGISVVPAPSPGPIHGVINKYDASVPRSWVDGVARLPA